MKDVFFKVTDSLSSFIEESEIFLCELKGETSDFVRFNKGLIRQSGHVDHYKLTLKLATGKKVVCGSFPITKDVDHNIALARKKLTDLRGVLPTAPEDPYFSLCEDLGKSIGLEYKNVDTPLKELAGVSGEVMAKHIVDYARGLDLVGILANGCQHSGFASSLGHKKYHESSSFNFDYACYLKEDKAVKGSYAGIDWNERELEKKMTDAAQKLEVLAKPVKTLSPAPYRVYLAPSAVFEIMSFMNWGGFSKKSIETKSSPLNLLYNGKKTMSPQVTYRQNFKSGFEADFDGHGHDFPEIVEFIDCGKPRSSLSSSRSAAEFKTSVNASGSGEGVGSGEMASGQLLSKDVLKELGTGIYISNLWYLNFSDRPSGVMTGMTRFACFWVEDGKLVAPINVMRFDDSIFNVLGDQLEALTYEREYILDAGSYGFRSSDSMLLPGILLKSLKLTL